VDRYLLKAESSRGRDRERLNLGASCITCILKHRKRNHHLRSKQLTVQKFENLIFEASNFRETVFFITAYIMGKGEIVTVAVGQCGNQLSRVFWELAELERVQCSQEKYSDYDECSLFRTSSQSNSTKSHRTLKARSILVDTEPAVGFPYQTIATLLF
jgi:hypothetical protein